jgi:hypothetical protein
MMWIGSHPIARTPLIAWAENRGVVIFNSTVAPDAFRVASMGLPISIAAATAARQVLLSFLARASKGLSARR